MFEITLNKILQAKRNISGKINNTPILTCDGINQRLGAEVYFKAEIFQKAGSFKIRGILNKLHFLSEKEKKKGVVAMSTGDHAISLAFAASILHIPCIVIMPTSTKKSKIKLIRDLGAKVILKDGNLWIECLKFQAKYGFVPFHPFDDPLIIAGHGTIGLEILRDLPDVKTVLVPIGGGGLISGIATAIKSKNSKIKIIGVEPRGAPTMFRSVVQNKIIFLKKRETIADGLAAPFVGKYTLPLVKKYVDELVLVSDKQIIHALEMLLEKGKMLVDPSGAASFAALLYGKISVLSGSKVVCILSGGNINKKELLSLMSLRR